MLIVLVTYWRVTSRKVEFTKVDCGLMTKLVKNIKHVLRTNKGNLFRKREIGRAA